MDKANLKDISCFSLALVPINHFTCVVLNASNAVYLIPDARIITDGQMASALCHTLHRQGLCLESHHSFSVPSLKLWVQGQFQRNGQL